MSIEEHQKQINFWQGELETVLNSLKEKHQLIRQRAEINKQRDYSIKIKLAEIKAKYNF